MNSLFIDQNLADFWPGFLALDKTAGGGGGGDQGGREGGNLYGKIQFVSREF